MGMLEIKNVLHKDNLDRIAKETGFIQRERSLDASTFVEVAILGKQNIGNTSFVMLSDKFSQVKNGSKTKGSKKAKNIISAQALHEKIDDKSYLFTKQLYNEMYAAVDNEVLLNIPYIKNIIISDSTKYKVSGNLGDFFKEMADKLGDKMNDSKKQVKLHMALELLTNNVTLIDTTAGNVSDISKNKEIMKLGGKDTLELKDLGYLKISNLKQLDKTGRSYVAKLKGNINVFERKDVTVNISDLRSTRYPNAITELDIDKLVETLQPGESKDIEVYVSKEEYKTRLVVTRLTKEQQEQKRKHLAKYCKRSKKDEHTRDDESKYSAYITNLSKDKFEASSINDLYSLRWQIELIFKTLKSIMEIDKGKAGNRERMLTYVYASLIQLLFTTALMNEVAKELPEEKRYEISIYKAAAIVLASIGELVRACNESEKYYLEYIEDLKTRVKKTV